jgi:hypothetical protein
MDGCFVAEKLLETGACLSEIQKWLDDFAFSGFACL